MADMFAAGQVVDEEVNAGVDRQQEVGDLY